MDRDRAEMFRDRMADAYADARTRIDSSHTPAMWRVVVGREMTREQADALARRVRTEAGAGVVIAEPDASLITRALVLNRRALDERPRE